MSVQVSRRINLECIPKAEALANRLAGPLRTLGCDLYLLDGFEQFERVDRGGFPLFGGFTSEHTTCRHGFSVIAKKEDTIVGTWAGGFWDASCSLSDLMDETSVFHSIPSGERWVFQGTAKHFAKALRGPFVKVGGFYLEPSVRSTDVGAGLIWFMQILGRLAAQEMFRPQGIFGFYIDEHVKRGISKQFRLTHLAEYVQRIQFSTGPMPYWLGLSEEVDVYRRAEELMDLAPAMPMPERSKPMTSKFNVGGPFNDDLLNISGKASEGGNR